MNHLNDMLHILEDETECCYVNDIYSMSQIPSYVQNNKTYLHVQTMLISFIFYASMILFFLLFAINILFNRKLYYCKPIALARAKRTKTKMLRVVEDAQIISDNIINLEFMIFRIGSRSSRLNFLLRSFIKLSIIDFKELKRIFKKLDKCNSKVFIKLALRIPHTVIYKFSIEQIMLNYKLDYIYTGQTYDRFALIEYALSREYNKKLICIPHGIISAQKFPVGYVGDTFYCPSYKIACELNSIYITNRYIFDDEIIKKMFCIEKNKKNTSKAIKRIVFFTQPVYYDATIKIIESVANHLLSKGLRLYVKPHPREKGKIYKRNNIELIHDINDAIQGNVCLSIMSTVLYEAMYNDSIPISIIYLLREGENLIDIWDYLKDERILKPANEKLLLELIDYQLNIKE